MVPAISKLSATLCARNWSDIICACAILSVETCPAIFSDVTQKNSGVSCKEWFSGWQVCNANSEANSGATSFGICYCTETSTETVTSSSPTDNLPYESDGFSSSSSIKD